MSQSASSAADRRRDAANFGAYNAPNFARANRHSARVRFVKRVLPVLLIGSLLAMILVPLVRQLSLKIELPFELGALHLSGTRLTMEVPKLSGFTDDGRAYKVNASTASQDLTNPDVLDLTDIDAQIELANKGWANVKSATGSVETKRQFIKLMNGVDLSTNGGYAGRLKDADVDAKAGTLVTTNPVVLTYRDGKLVADSMTITDRGSRAFFQGHVQLDFTMSDLSDKQQAAPAAPAPAAPAAPAAPKGAKR
ncbi:hypothetical protein ABLE91_06230 [Aquabacter sp. CN5-332]|uniref:hypothetical protein n=1 Tax=Aquabacter sp. CN5-332 TaxID=3156608 RepID=UPI0032B336A6